MRVDALAYLRKQLAAVDPDRSGPYPAAGSLKDGYRLTLRALADVDDRAAVEDQVHAG